MDFLLPFLFDIYIIKIERHLYGSVPMENKYYPLTPAQMTLFYAQKYSLLKSSNTICISCFFKREFDMKILKEAMLELFNRHECLQIRIKQKTKTEVFQYLDKTPPEIKFLDFSSKTEKAQEKSISKFARKNYTKFGKPMFEITLAKSYDGYPGFVFAVSHVIMDSHAIFMLLHDIYNIYTALEKGTVLPKAPASYISVLEKDLQYKNTPAYENDMKFWTEQFSLPEPTYTDTLGPSVLENYRKKKKDPTIKYVAHLDLLSLGRHSVHIIPAQEVKKIMDYCLEKHVSLQCLFTAALYIFLSKRNNGIDDIVINALNSRRGSYAEKTCGGTRVHVHNFRMNVPHDKKFSQFVVDVFENLITMYKHMYFSPLEAMGLRRKMYNLPMGATYGLSAITVQTVAFPDNFVDFRAKWHSNGVATNPFYLSVMNMDKSGDLYCYYEYRTKYYSEDLISSIHKYIMYIINKGISSDDITIGEIIAKKHNKGQTQ